MKKLKELEVNEDFDLVQTTVRGPRRTYRDTKVTLGCKDFDGVWHNWWSVKIADNWYGMVYLSPDYQKHMKEAVYDAAKRSIDRLLDENATVKVRTESPEESK